MSRERILTLSNKDKVVTHTESVGDPAGRVFEYDDKVYRVISNGFKDLIQDLVTSKIFSSFCELGLIETVISDLEVTDFEPNSANMVLEHRKIDFNSFQIEWTPNMIQDAVLTLLKLGKFMYENGYMYKDGNLHNIMFDYTVPKFVDIGSILPLNRIPNTGKYEPLDFPWEFSGFFTRDCIAVLASHTSNITVKDAFCIRDNYKTDIEGYFDTLIEYILSAELKYEITEWSQYGKAIEPNTKNPKVVSFLDILNGIDSGSILDIGANKGNFSYEMETLGFKVIACDIDILSMMQTYTHAKKNNKKILPLVLDFMNLTPQIRGCKPAIERLRCDTTVFLALIHHLCLRRDITFDEICSRLDKLSNRNSIVEFIPLGDRHVGGWHKHSWYTQENFIKTMEKFGFSKHIIFPSAPDPRTLILFQR